MANGKRLPQTLYVSSFPELQLDFGLSHRGTMATQHCHWVVLMLRRPAASASVSSPSQFPGGVWETSASITSSPTS